MSKKITRIDGAEESVGNKTTTQFKPTEEAKGKATQFRLFAMLAWLLAMAGQVFAILKLISNETMVWLIVAIVVILALAITGSTLWKKANRLDPASEKDKVRLFIQNQLGAIMGVLAFLPLVILIFTNKDIDGKTKGIAGSIAVVAMLIAGISGADFNPPSIEQYTDQINEVESLTGSNFVYWTPFGTRYHLYSDCSHINSDKTSEISEGGVQQARELKNITELCSRCKGKAEKEKELKSIDISELVEELEAAN
jgi:hypothetical protein